MTSYLKGLCMHNWDTILESQGWAEKTVYGEKSVKVCCSHWLWVVFEVFTELGPSMLQCKKDMYFSFDFDLYSIHLDIVHWEQGLGGGKVVASQLLVVVVPLLNSGWTLWLSLWLNSGGWSLLMRGFECLEQNIKIKEQ